MLAPDEDAGIEVALRDKGVAAGGIRSRGWERAPARSDMPRGVDERDRADLRQGLEIRQKAMQLLVVLDPVPVEAADPVVDPREHQRVGLERAERMLVQLAGLDRDPLLRPGAGPAGSSARRQSRAAAAARRAPPRAAGATATSSRASRASPTASAATVVGGPPETRAADARVRAPASRTYVAGGALDPVALHPRRHASPAGIRHP